MIYDGDPLWTLTPLAAAGVAMLGLSLAGATLVAFERWRPPRRTWAVLAAIAVFWVYLWVSPQVFYLYFLAVIDGLPLQWVAKLPPPIDVIRSLTFSGPAQLGRHAEGVLGWLLLALSLRSPARGVRP